MNRYKLTISYDGTDFFGWAQQPHQVSIAQTMQDSFCAIFGRKIRLMGASRTDAGVHALGQVALCETDLIISADKLKWAWNNGLPSTIRIDTLQHAPHFHPHRGVVEKIYYYHIFVDRPHPFYARYGVKKVGNIDWHIFRQALQCFQGTHDFKAFYTGNNRDDTVRTINEVRLNFIEQYGCYRVEVIGEKFLRHMIRRMIGAALAVATRSSLSLCDVEKALNEGKLNCELPTADAQGLMLYSIKYAEDL